VPFQSLLPLLLSRSSLGKHITSLTSVVTIAFAAAVSAGCCFLSGCAVSNADIKTYVDPDFTGSSIHRLAVFPIRDRRITASEARQLDAVLSKTILKKAPSIVIISSTEAAKVLNENGLQDQAARFLENYFSKEFPSPSILRKIGQTLGVDGIIQGEISNIQQTDGVVRGHKGRTHVTVRYSLTGVGSGKLLWEASSDGSVTTVTTAESAPPIIYAALVAQEKVLAMLPF
jgi:hypothetical protein